MQAKRDTCPQLLEIPVGVPRPAGPHQLKTPDSQLNLRQAHLAPSKLGKGSDPHNSSVASTPFPLSFLQGCNGLPSHSILIARERPRSLSASVPSAGPWRKLSVLRPSCDLLGCCAKGWRPLGARLRWLRLQSSYTGLVFWSGGPISQPWRYQAIRSLRLL